MKHVLFADKTILVSDAAADALVEYGAALAAHDSADSVTYSGIGADGAAVVVSFLLNAGASLVIETTPSELPEPDNDEEIARVCARIDALTSPHPVQPSNPDDTYAVDPDIPYET